MSSDRSRGTREDPPGTVQQPDGVIVAPAEPDDRLDVLRIVDAAMLEVDADTLADRIGAGDVFVARAEATGTVVGALTVVRSEPDEATIEAVAVRRERRGRGIGSALVATATHTLASERGVERVTATFEPSLLGLYTDLGFVTGDEGSERKRNTGERKRNTGERDRLCAVWSGE